MAIFSANEIRTFLNIDIRPLCSIQFYFLEPVLVFGSTYFPMSQNKICLARQSLQTTPFLNGLSAWQANCEIGWCSHMFLSWWWWCWWERERERQFPTTSSSTPTNNIPNASSTSVVCSRCARSRCYRTTSLLGYLMFISAWILPLMMILLGELASSSRS